MAWFKKITFTRKQQALLVCLVVINIALWLPASAQPKREMSVVFLNVGQGDAMLITAPNGRQMLIDGGPDSTVLAELATQMRFADRSIDVMVATHADADHIGGLPDVLFGYRVDMIITPCVSADTGLYDEFTTASDDEQAEIVCARRGMRVVLDEESGVFADILFPDRDMSEASDRNDSSIALKLTYGEIDFMFTGDASQEIEQYLVYLDSADLDAEIVKLGHHGSRTSTSDSFLKATTPEIAVISAGTNNSFGHPHDEVLETLARNRVPYIGTHADGRLVFVTDGVTWWIK